MRDDSKRLDKAARTRERGPIQADHRGYLATIAETPHHLELARRLGLIEARIRDLLRKELGSENALKAATALTRLVYKVRKDMDYRKLPPYHFHRELQVLSRYLVSSSSASTATALPAGRQ